MTLLFIFSAKVSFLRDLQKFYVFSFLLSVCTIVYLSISVKFPRSMKLSNSHDFVYRALARLPATERRLDEAAVSTTRYAGFAPPRSSAEGFRQAFFVCFLLFHLIY